MVIQFNCTYCDKFLKVKDEAAGRKVKCPGCKMSIEVPLESDEKKYIIKKGDGQIGPIKFIDVADMVTKGDLRGTDMVAVFGSEAFKPVKEYSEFTNLSKMASQKSMVKTAKSGVGLMIKIGLIAVAISLFFIGKEMWTIRRINSYKDRIEGVTKLVKRGNLKSAQEILVQLKQEIPDHRKVREIEQYLKDFEERILAAEKKNYEKVGKEIDDLEKQIREAVAAGNYEAARNLLTTMKGKVDTIGRIPFMKEESKRGEIKQLNDRHESLRAYVAGEYETYLTSMLDEIQKQIDLGEALKAKDLYNKVMRMKYRSSKVNYRLETIRNSLRNAPAKKPAGDSKQILAGLKSPEPEQQLEAMKTVILKEEKFDADSLNIFSSKLDTFLSSKTMFYPALDVMLFNGSGADQYQDILKKYKQVIAEAPVRSGATPPLRKIPVFTTALVDYAITNGGIDKEDFLIAFLSEPMFVKELLESASKRLDASRAPNLKNAIERIVIEHKDIDTVRAAIKALGNMKSTKSAQLLVQIINYTACSKCRLGNGTSGTSYLFEPLFCAKCREGDAYTQGGSLFRTALEALGKIKNRDTVADLQKILAAEEKSGHSDLVKVIRKTISEIKGE